jgi:hypothetical protein
MKLTKRKGFNFFRSYYDVYNELETDKDKVAFMDALLDRQFQGVIPTNLKGMAKFAYISQVNSIDTQVKGYEDKAISLNRNVKNYNPWQGVKNISTTPTQQVEEKGKGKGKEETIIPIKNIEVDSFLIWFNDMKLKHKGVEGKFKTLSATDTNNLLKLKQLKYTSEDWEHAFKMMLENDWVKDNGTDTPTHFLVNTNFTRYLNKDSSTIKPEYKSPHQKEYEHIMNDNDY